MNKEIIKDKIKSAIFQLDMLIADEHNPGSTIKNTIEVLEDILKELSKSDWISVKDKLPPYDKSVLVCNENDLTDIWFCHRSCDPQTKTDDDGWCNYFPITITHWQDVEMDDLFK